MSWETILGVDLQVFGGRPELINDPSIPVSIAGFHAFTLFGDNKIIDLPDPLIGNATVKKAIDENRLQNNQNITDALDMLTSTLF